MTFDVERLTIDQVEEDVNRHSRGLERQMALSGN